MARLGPRVAAQLQAQAGNRAVARLVAQRSGGVAGQTEAEAPVVRPDASVQRLRPGPDSDPKFRSLKRDVRVKQHRLSAHPPAKAEAARAQGAAQAPPDDKQAYGKAAQAEKMNAAKPGDFDKAAFIAAVNEAIAKKAPKNLSEAKDFGGSGKAGEIKGEVAGKVTAGKKASAAAIESTTKAAPDTSQVKEKAVTPLAPDQAPPTPAAPPVANAVPDKAPPEATDFSAGPKQVDGAMADAQVTEEQLATSNEPEFAGALESKKQGEEHSATAPGQLRASEAQTLSTAKAEAGASGKTAMATMALGRRSAGAAVAAGKQSAKSTDESRRAKVTGILQKVFDATKTEVEAILTGIDDKVTGRFDTGEKAARDAFSAEHQQKMDDYKDRRYSGIRGKGRWIRDKFRGLPAEANQIFVTARQGYVSRMKQVIASVADLIAAELARAKARIAKGREELQAEVKKLPKDLQAIGKQAAGEFSEKFDELTESVNSKGSELVETLASKYTDALGKVDEEIEAEKEKNKGLIDKAIDAVAGVIKTILQLKDMLLGVLAKAGQAVMAIIKDPIGFLGNLVSAVGAGLSAFMGRIGEHLQKGLVSWLLGSASSMGIQLPEKFDLRGIIMMVASMLGLTWDAIKARVISRGVPAQAIEAAEGSLPLIAKLRAGGIGDVWEDIKARVGDLKKNLFSKITEYLVPTVLMAGITWIISLLNPASAFIKACKMIIDVITFIVTRGAQILEFVSSVLDAVIAIAAGGSGGVPALIENALAKSIPVLIGALAAILGIGGVADKVKAFFQSLAKPMFKAVDWITDKIVGVGKKVWGKMKAAGRKIKAKAKAGIAKVKARAKAGIGKVKDRFGRRRPGQEPSVADKAAIAAKAANEGLQAIKRVPPRQVGATLGQVHARWEARGVKGLQMVPLGSHSFTVSATVNPVVNAKGKVTANLDPEALHVDETAATSFASSTTSATGIFETDGAPELSEVLTSGAGKAELHLTDSQEGAHAEEQVTNHFQKTWENRLRLLVGALKKSDKKKVAAEKAIRKPFTQVRMVMNVSKSSCINCASHIARFTRELDTKASSVAVAMRFAALYRGRQEVTKSNMDEFGGLVRLFLDKGRLSGAGNLWGRVWGRVSADGAKKERVTEVSASYDAGRAGLAILKSAGIHVEGIDIEDIKGRKNAEKRLRLEKRKARLEAAISEVDQEVKKQKG